MVAQPECVCVVQISNFFRVSVAWGGHHFWLFTLCRCRLFCGPLASHKKNELQSIIISSSNMAGLSRIFQAIFGNGNRSPSMDYSNPFLQWFNIGALLMVVLPMLVAAFARNGDGGGHWWNYLWRNDGDDEEDNNSNDEDGQTWWERIAGAGNHPLELFVYLSALVVFGALIWFGNRIFRRGAFTLPLLTALLVFSIMALLLALVLAAPVRHALRSKDADLHCLL